MSLFPEIKAAIEQTSAAFDEFKKVQDRQLAGIKHEQSELLDRIESLEAKGMRPGLTAGERKADAEHLLAFKNWVRKPHDQMAQAALSQAENAALERKDVTIGSPAGGGYAVPALIHPELELRLRAANPLLGLVKRVTAGSADFAHLVGLNDSTTAGWVGEAGPRNVTQTPALRERKPTHGELYAYPQVSEWALDDVQFDVRQWLVESLADTFGAAMSDAILTGNGTNKPTGLLSSAPTNETDEAGTRAADAIEYVKTGDANAITVASLFDLAFKIGSQYLDGSPSVGWVMHRSTLAAIAKLTLPGGNQMLLQPSLSETVPLRLLGYPVHLCDHMPTIAANSHPVVFGNFRRGYLLADRGPLRITPDNITNVGFMRFYIRGRYFGCILNNNAIKCLKVMA